VERREVKLGQTLSALIERGGYSGNRRDILAALDISPAALSQYARDQTRPSFQKLVALADFFGVSLDYLVYGEVREPAVSQSFTTGYVERTWQEVAANTRRHTALVGRMGRVIADRMDEVARELAATSAAGGEGVIQDDEAARIERFCRSVDILTLNLDYDMVTLKDGSATAGRFMDVVANNLLAGCDYRFLVPVGSENVIDQFRNLLTDRVGRDLVSRNCSFRRTAQPVFSGIVIYRLDMDRLGAEEPVLHAQIQDFIGSGGELGYVIRPNEESNSDMLMGNEHRHRAEDAFSTLWSSAKP
jgi:transcriptional regulator with XRE-family HTH domain